MTTLLDARTKVLDAVGAILDEETEWIDELVTPLEWIDELVTPLEWIEELVTALESIDELVTTVKLVDALVKKTGKKLCE